MNISIRLKYRSNNTEMARVSSDYFSYIQRYVLEPDQILTDLIVLLFMLNSIATSLAPFCMN